MQAKPRLGVVGDQRKVPAQLDQSGQLTLVLPNAAESIASGVIDNEHARELGAMPRRYKSACLDRVIAANPKLADVSASPWNLLM